MTFYYQDDLGFVHLLRASSDWPVLSSLIPYMLDPPVSMILHPPFYRAKRDPHRPGQLPRRSGRSDVPPRGGASRRPRRPGNGWLGARETGNQRRRGMGTESVPVDGGTVRVNAGWPACRGSGLVAHPW